MPPGRLLTVVHDLIEPDRRGGYSVNMRVSATVMTTILVTAGLLEGCAFHGCEDDLESLTPANEDQQVAAHWRDAQTLELEFSEALRAPDTVDPSRFALLRYRAEFVTGDVYYCEFDVCHRELDEAPGIPIAVDWSPDDPQVLRLEFSEAVVASECSPWSNSESERTTAHALELIYDGGTDTAPDTIVRFAEGGGPPSAGPEELVERVRACRTEDACAFAESCAGSYGYRSNGQIRVACP